MATHLCPPTPGWKARASHPSKLYISNCWTQSGMSSLKVLECHLWLTMTEIKEADNVPFLDAPVHQAACLDRLWRALLNASRRLRSRLKRCDNSSLSAPALLLLPVTLGLRQLSRQLSQCQSPLSPNLLRVGEIEGAHARHDPTPSRSTKDPGPRSSWIRRLQKSS